MSAPHPAAASGQAIKAMRVRYENLSRNSPRIIILAPSPILGDQTTSSPIQQTQKTPARSSSTSGLIQMLDYYHRDTASISCRPPVRYLKVNQSDPLLVAATSNKRHQMTPFGIVDHIVDIRTRNLHQRDIPVASLDSIKQTETSSMPDPNTRVRSNH